MVTKASGRSAALHKADAVVARRAAEIRQHEATLRNVLTEYFRARDGADLVRADARVAVDRIRHDTDARIAQVQDQANQTVASFEEQARVAVRQML